MAACSLKTCSSGRIASLRPVLILFASVDTVPAVASVGVAVCEPCSRSLAAADFLTDPGWLKIEAAFVSAGKSVPARELTGLRFDPIPDRPARRGPGAVWRPRS